LTRQNWTPCSLLYVFSRMVRILTGWFIPLLRGIIFLVL
jgi:hypothetical protein